jgi:siderophore synthetase component
MTAPEDLVSWEALSALKDRPFHPLARAKDWDKSDGTAYLPEMAAAFSLHWMALPRRRVLGQPFTGQPLAEALLDPAQREWLAAVARRRGASTNTHLWIPVHPWQREHLHRMLSTKMAGCLDLGAGPGMVIPTASLRSLAVVGQPNIHIKLSLSVNTLGAVRTLPPRYLHNGVLASACLNDVRQKDEWLGAHLLLCDESNWWALQQQESLQAESGELACMMRRYPALPGATLIPMAALPVVTADGALPAFNYLLGPDLHEEAAWRLFADIALALLELGLRCFAYGVMPELHGQNVVMALQKRKIFALVLRDHDSLRICRTMMQTQGLDAPDYVIDRSTPNTLELDTPRELLAYLQTLAIEVNLYAILAALAERYGRDEMQGWNIVRAALESCLARISLPEDIAEQTRGMLLNERCWPFKQVLAPLLGQKEFSSGMPSAMGQVANPLLRG